MKKFKSKKIKKLKWSHSQYVYVDIPVEVYSLRKGIWIRGATCNGIKWKRIIEKIKAENIILSYINYGGDSSIVSISYLEHT